MFVLPRLVFESLSVMLIFTIMKSIFNHFDIGYLAVISIGMITLSHLLHRRFATKTVIAVGIAISLALGLAHTDFNWFFRGVYVLYYLYVWMSGIRLNLEHEDPSVYMRKFFFTGFVMVVLMITVGLSNIFYYIDTLSVYFLMYAVAVMLYIGKLNIESVYTERAANAMKRRSRNQYKGVLLNLFIILLVVFLIATALVNNADFFRDLLELALRPVGYMGERLSHFIENRLIERTSDNTDGEFLGIADEVTEMYTVDETRDARRSINYKLIAQIIFILGLVGGLVYYGLRLMKQHRVVEIEEEDYREIRENVFSSRLLYDNTLGRLLSTARKWFERSEKEPVLDFIRQRYRNVVALMIRSGQQISMSDTPDEILRKVVLIPEERESFERLTEVYKLHRYARTAPPNELVQKILDEELSYSRSE